jgi:transcriptional regulator with XRE-family HTH domain
MRQQQLARMLDIHESLLSKVVNGFREPGPELRQRMAAALHCDARWLFERLEAGDCDAAPQQTEGDVQ